MKKTVRLSGSRGLSQMALAWLSQLSKPMIWKLPKGCILYFLYVTVTTKTCFLKATEENVWGLFSVLGSLFIWLGFGHWPGASIRGHGRYIS